MLALSWPFITVTTIIYCFIMFHANNSVWTASMYISLMKHKGNKWGLTHKLKQADTKIIKCDVSSYKDLTALPHVILLSCCLGIKQAHHYVQHLISIRLFGENIIYVHGVKWLFAQCLNNSAHPLSFSRKTDDPLCCERTSCTTDS